MSSNKQSRKQVPWWNTEFGEKEIEAVGKAISSRRISQGSLTVEFEEKLSSLLGVNHAIAVSNGSIALLMALMTLEVGVGDEVLIPNRTWIATLHAVMMTGATPVLVDVREDRPLLDESRVEKKISERTKAVIPVHLNGRSVNVSYLNRLAEKYGFVVIEDTAQALMSKNYSETLGTIGEIGCFSLSMAKIISTGQGGFLATNDDAIAQRLRLIRTHGVENVQDPDTWGEYPGLNFRFTDLQASIGLVQAEQLPKRIEKVSQIYQEYRAGLENCDSVEVVPVAVERGEIPLYTEILCDNRKQLMAYLEFRGIETRPAVPNLNRAKYLQQTASAFLRSDRFEKCGLTLPSGPGQKLRDIKFVIQCIQSYVDQKSPFDETPREC